MYQPRALPITRIFRSITNVLTSSFILSSSHKTAINNIKQQSTDILLAKVWHDVQLKLVDPYMELGRRYPQALDTVTLLQRLR